MKKIITSLYALITFAFIVISQASLTSTEITYFHTDHQGSVIASTDSDGNLVWQQRYHPFGDTIEKNSSDVAKLEYTGKPHFNDMQLSYYGSRWYDRELGRFTGIDPVGWVEGNSLHSLGRYTYVNNNPYRYVDPDGEFFLALTISFAAWIVSDFVIPRFQDAPAFDSGVAVSAGFPLDFSAVLGVSKAFGGVTTKSAAGSIRNVNPTRGTQNCVNCSIATDATLAGRPASALSGSPTSIRALEMHFGSSFGSTISRSGIENLLLKTGNGARGIVFGSRGSQTGHVFNVLNQKGTIRFLDGQTGKPASFDGFQSLHLLKTN